MSKLISALLISVSLIASHTVFAVEAGSPCRGTDGKFCNSGTEGCICKKTIRDKIKDDIKSKIKDNRQKSI